MGLSVWAMMVQSGEPARRKVPSVDWRRKTMPARGEVTFCIRVWLIWISRPVSDCSAEASSARAESRWAVMPWMAARKSSGVRSSSAWERCNSASVRSRSRVVNSKSRWDTSPRLSACSALNRSNCSRAVSAANRAAARRVLAASIASGSARSCSPIWSPSDSTRVLAASRRALAESRCYKMLAKRLGSLSTISKSGSPS